MQLILKPVVAQCYRGKRYIGSRKSARDRSVIDWSNGARETGREWFIRRGVSMALGYFLGSVFIGDSAPEHEERRLELKRMSEESDALREKMVSNLMESARKKNPLVKMFLKIDHDVLSLMVLYCVGIK